MSLRYIVGLIGFSLSLSVLAAGCGGSSDRPELARVRGRVTLDGVPVPAAKVYFQPAQGRPSFGSTDSDGVYELMYVADVRGAVIGTHEVKISTYDVLEIPETGSRNVVQEILPDIYHARSNLKAEVKPGTNEIAFELKSLKQ